MRNNANERAVKHLRASPSVVAQFVLALAGMWTAKARASRSLVLSALLRAIDAQARASARSLSVNLCVVPATGLPEEIQLFLLSAPTTERPDNDSWPLWRRRRQYWSSVVRRADEMSRDLVALRNKR